MIWVRKYFHFLYFMKEFVEDYYFIVYTRLFKISGFPHGSGKGNGNSSVLAWRIPWMEEPDRLQSMESQRVRHNWVTHTHTHTHSSLGKESVCNTGNPGSIPGLGRSAGEGIRPALVCFIASFSFLLFSLCYKLRVYFLLS